VTEIDAQLAAGLSRRFRIVRRLGEGGMGAVFLAEQIALGNRPVALKVLSRKLLDDPDFLLRFQNEAASTGRIHHPNVVTSYESGQADDGTPYIAMEFLEDESLRQDLTRRGAPVKMKGKANEQAGWVGSAPEPLIGSAARRSRNQNGLQPKPLRSTIYG
jgi:serine/threonine protein kinase